MLTVDISELALIVRWWTDFTMVCAPITTEARLPSEMLRHIDKVFTRKHTHTLQLFCHFVLWSQFRRKFRSPSGFSVSPNRWIFSFLLTMFFIFQHFYILCLQKALEWKKLKSKHHKPDMLPCAEEQCGCQYGCGFTIAALGECCLYHTSVKSNNTTKVQLLVVNIFSPW